MKKIIFLLLTIFSLQSFAQETSKGYDRIGRFDHGVALVWKNKLVGMIKINGKEIVKPEYEKIGSFGGDNLAFTTRDGMIGIINLEGKVVVHNIYQSISQFKGSYAITKMDGLYGIINKKGKVLVDNKYQKLKMGKYGDVRAVKDGQEILLDIKD
ncbi:MAG: WG repeat-containing protein [Ferruginibacter sp.]